MMIVQIKKPNGDPISGEEVQNPSKHPSYEVEKCLIMIAKRRGKRPP